DIVRPPGTRQGVAPPSGHDGERRRCGVVPERWAPSGSKNRHPGVAWQLQASVSYFKLQIIPTQPAGMIMIFRIDRRAAIKLGLGTAGSAFIGTHAIAQDKDTVTIGWPSDVPSWDPNQRFVPDAQPIFKLVFDQPLDQSEKLELIPKLITKWALDPDGLS